MKGAAMLSASAIVLSTAMGSCLAPGPKGISFIQLQRQHSSCTGEGQDPYSSGGDADCCGDLQRCLGDWSSNGNWHYLCRTSCNSQPAPAPAPAPSPGGSSGNKRRGQLTMWGDQSNLIGSQCEYANAPINSLTDPVLPSYLRSGFHCAIGDANPAFGRGEHCGACYRITSLSDTGTAGTPGKASSATVMVSNGGAGGPAHFDCILESFESITGAQTGIFDVEFEEVQCEEVTGNLVAINWADKNAYYCKMMFENVGGWGSLESVRLCLDGSSNCGNLQRSGGATWTGCPTGEARSVTITLTQKNPSSGDTEDIDCQCGGTSWPWDTGYQCQCQSNFR